MKNSFVKYLFFLSALFFFCKNISAQDNKPLRVEIEAKSNSGSYVIIPFGAKGILLFYKSNETNNNDEQKWFFTLYDTIFKEVWTKQQAISKELKYQYFDFNENNLYLYFENAVTAASTGSIQILKIDIDNAEIKPFNTVIPIKSVVTKFKVINDVAMLSGHTLPKWGSTFAQTLFSITLIPLLTGATLYSYQPFLFTYNFAKGESKIIPTYYKGQAYAQDIATDFNKQVFDITIKDFIPRKTNILFVDEYNTEGSKTNTLKLITNDESRKLNTVKVVSLDANEKIIIGTYNNNTKGNRANPAFEGFTEGATGIYFCNIINGEQKNLNFYNFSKFKNFYSSINNRRAGKMMKKAMRKEAEGKEMSYNYQLLVHNIIKRDSSYIMIAEAYYPEYHTEYYTSFDFYGRPYTTSFEIFDGYRYTDAIIACFNKQGVLLWDNSFEIWNILNYDLHERVKVLLDGEDIVLAYSSEGKIASKIISGNEVTEGTQYTKIETNFNDDKLLSDYNSDMEYWYGNYFISYGYQKIKNENQNKSKRTVFYFNKIAFQ